MLWLWSIERRGSSFSDWLAGEQTVTIFTPEAEHLALPGFVYGGIVASLIDCHGTGSAALAPHRKMDMKRVMVRSPKVRNGFLECELSQAHSTWATFKSNWSRT